MDTTQKIIKNIFSLFAGRFISVILSVILSIYLARFLGDALFGRYSFVVAFVALFSIFLDLGYETLLIREVAKDKSKASKYLNNVITFRAILSILIFTVIFVLINIFGFAENVKFIIYLFGISQILISFSNVFMVIFRAFERMEVEALLGVISNIIRCSISIFILFLGYGLTEIALVFLYVAIFDFSISFLICEKKFVRTKSQFDLTFFRDTIKIALPLGFLAIFGLIYVKIDTVMLTYMKGEAVVGWYNAAYNLILGFAPVPHLFMHALLPFMSYSYEISKNSLRNVYEKSFKFLIVVGLPITVGIFLLADKFILLFYGQEFLNSVSVLRILSWDILLKFLYICVLFILISADKQKKLAIIAGGAAFLNIVLNLFLIPEFSLIGAAIATILTETFLLLVFIYILFINNLVINLKRSFIKPLIACAAMTFFIITFREIHLYLIISVSILTYFGVLILIKGISKEELTLIKNIIKRK